MTDADDFIDAELIQLVKTESMMSRKRPYYSMRLPRSADEAVAVDTDLDDDDADDLDDADDGRRTPTGQVVPSGATGLPRAPSTPPPAPAPLRRSTTMTAAAAACDRRDPVAIMTHMGTLVNTGSAAASAAAATFVNAVGAGFAAGLPGFGAPPAVPAAAAPGMAFGAPQIDDDDAGLCAERDEAHKRTCADRAYRELCDARDSLHFARICSDTEPSKVNDEVQRLIASAAHDVAAAIEILQTLRRRKIPTGSQ